MLPEARFIDKPEHGRNLIVLRATIPLWTRSGGFATIMEPNSGGLPWNFPYGQGLWFGLRTFDWPYAIRVHLTSVHAR